MVSFNASNDITEKKHIQSNYLKKIYDNKKIAI